MKWNFWLYFYDPLIGNYVVYPGPILFDNFLLAYAAGVIMSHSTDEYLVGLESRMIIHKLEVGVVDEPQEAKEETETPKGKDPEETEIPSDE